MADNVLILGDPVIFKLMPRDIDHLFSRSGLKGNVLAPFKYTATEGQYPQPSEWAQSFLEAQIFDETVKVLLEPHLKLIYHTGGGGTKEDVFSVLIRSDNRSVLMITKNKEEDFLGLLFADINGFLDWWGSLYAANIADVQRSSFEGTMPLETVVSILHSLDSYRRAYMESMLGYNPKLNISIKKTEFINTLAASLASGDVRWLLPSMFRLTPDLPGANLQLLPEHLQALEQMGFVTVSSDTLTGESLFSLGERGKALGTEFFHTWINSIGWKASVLADSQEKVISRVYLAPTAFANHLFSFQAQPEGKFKCNHQSLSKAELRSNLNEWYKTIYALVVKNVATLAPSQPDIQTSPGQESISAASPSKPDKQSTKISKCPTCGHRAEKGQRFCGECGTSLS